MQPLMDRFCDTLSAEREVHKELLTLSAQKKEAITKNDVPSLDRIVRGEEVLLSRLNHWEKRRKECVRGIAARVDRPASEIILQDFLPLCNDSQRERLTELHREMTTLLEKQIAVNELNKRLIESRLEYIDFSLDTMAGTGEGAYQTYDGGRDLDRPTHKINIIDQKV